MAERYLPLFPSPVLITETGNGEDTNTALEDAIRTSLKDKGWKRVSSRNGYRSHDILQDLDSASIRLLKDQILKAACKITYHTNPGIEGCELSPWLMLMWGNINPPGSWNESHAHAHRDYQWSGVYYIRGDGERTPNLGNLIIEDRSGVPLPKTPKTPKTPETPFKRRDICITPKPGRLVIFPAFLHHRVELNTSSEDRISIAFNLRSDMLTLPLYQGMVPPNWRWRNFPWAMRWIAHIEGMFKGNKKRS